MIFRESLFRTPGPSSAVVSFNACPANGSCGCLIGRSILATLIVDLKMNGKLKVPPWGTLQEWGWEGSLAIGMWIDLCD